MKTIVKSFFVAICLLSFKIAQLSSLELQNPVELETTSTTLDPLAITEKLLKTTEANLKTLKELKQAIESYNKTLALFTKEENNKELAEAMVKEAKIVRQLIYGNHLEHLYATNQRFLKELEYFPQFHSKP